jgi:hypothetical protein
MTEQAIFLSSALRSLAAKIDVYSQHFMFISDTLVFFNVGGCVRTRALEQSVKKKY